MTLSCRPRAAEHTTRNTGSASRHALVEPIAPGWTRAFIFYYRAFGMKFAS